MKLSISKEAKVGLLTLLCGVILYVGFNFLKGIELFTDTNLYYAVYDKTEGLKISNPVVVNGLAVGRVSNIQLMQNRQNRVLLTLEINEEIILSDSTIAQFADLDMLGTKCIMLDLPAGSRVLQDGDTLRTGRKSGLIDSFKEAALPVMGSVDSTLLVIRQTLQTYKAMNGEIQQILRNTADASARANKYLADNQDRLSRITANLDQMSASMARQTDEQVKPLLQKSNQIADSVKAMQLAATATEMRQTVSELKQTMQAINRQEGTIGLLVKNDSLYHSMNKTLSDLDSLFIDLRKRPKRYVHFSLFGRKDKEEKKK